jgi:hypothetical protein
MTVSHLAFRETDLEVILNSRILSGQRLGDPKFTGSITTIHARTIYIEQCFLINLLSGICKTIFYNKVRRLCNILRIFMSLNFQNTGGKFR